MNATAKELLIRSRRRIFGARVGAHLSAFVGSGLDFSELDEYRYGDDVRHINWKATARAQRLYVNRFNEERELNIVLGICMGGSAWFGSVRQKREAMAELAALLGFAAVGNGDRLSVQFYDHEPLRYFAPSKAPRAVEGVIEYAMGLSLLGRRSDMQGCIEYLLQTQRRRSVVILIGDFLEAVDLDLLGARHELYLVVVRDRFEESPDFGGELELVDPETDRGYVLHANRQALRAWEDRIARIDAGLREQSARHAAGMCKIYTDDDPLPPLREMLK